MTVRSDDRYLIFINEYFKNITSRLLLNIGFTNPHIFHKRAVYYPQLLINMAFFEGRKSREENVAL